METKHILQSKTFWINLLACSLGIFAVVTPDTLTQLGLGEHAQTQVLAGIGLVTTILNVILRFISNTPVTLK